jgi:hypothetical protein
MLKCEIDLREFSGNDIHLDIGDDRKTEPQQIVEGDVLSLCVVDLFV